MSKQTTVANEFISLILLLLMTASLAAGQADATPSKTQDIDAPVKTAPTTHRN